MASSPWHKVFYSRSVFLPTYLYHFSKNRIDPRRNPYNYINRNLVLGELPTKRNLEKIHANGRFSGILSVNEPFELTILGHGRIIQKFCSNFNVRWLNLNVSDYQAPSLSQVKEGVSFIEHCTQNDSVCFLHCKAGRARSATIAICYLMKTQRITPWEAEFVVMNKRSPLYLNEEQLSVCADYYEQNVLCLFNNNLTEQSNSTPLNT